MAHTSMVRLQKAYGLSLIEMAVVMVFVSLALVPVVQMIGKPSTTSGNVARLTAMKSQETVLANAVVERALSGDYSVITCGGAPFNPATDTGNPQPVCEDSEIGMGYNQDLYYKWTTEDMTGGQLPLGNTLVKATLNVYDNPSATPPAKLTIPTFFHSSDGPGTTPAEKTGLVFVLDISGSMAGSSGTSPTPVITTPGVAPIGGKRLASPYLRYRYNDPTISFTVPAFWGLAPLDFNNNAEMDIVKAMQTDDTETPWDDRYPRATASPTGAGLPIYFPRMLNGTNQYDNGTQVLHSIFHNGGLFGGNADDKLRNFNSSTTLTWTDTLNNNLSRIEAARTALLSLVLDMESNTNVRDNLSMGFVTFSGALPGNAKVEVPMEQIGTGNPDQFDANRRRISWLNREGPGMIENGGGTPMCTGMREGATLLVNDTTVKNRILVVIGDGQPNTDMCKSNKNDYKKLAEAINTGGTDKKTGYDGKGKPVTLYTLGLIWTDPTLGEFLRDSIACYDSTGPNPSSNDMQRTPCLPAGNSYNYAKDIGDIDEIFQQLSYQIQTQVMISATQRYAGFDNI